MIATRTDSEALHRTVVETALGRFVVAASANGLRSLVPLGAGARPSPAAEHDGGEPRHLGEAAAALLAYCEGDPSPYGGALDRAGTEFQLRVWRRLLAVPYGAQITYGTLAADLGLPGDARAVGTAVAANPIAILVPCHRVVGAGGTLRGYAWGLDLKRRLLARELRLSPAFQPEGGRDTGRA
jgi:methylated-DNA-[protein]-cysteine S-methyltransferase